MYNSPKKAKRLFFDVIPRHVDNYLVLLEKYAGTEPSARLDNATWHIHAGDTPEPEGHVTFALLLNLASVCNTEDAAVLGGFITRYAPDATIETAPILAALVEHAIAYYRDFVKPTKQYRAPNAIERAALEDLVKALNALPVDADAETIQTKVYEVGKYHNFENLRDWFRALYETLFGQSQGPRFGSFVALYGKDATTELIHRVLTGEAVEAS